jgi:hypothetical protein
VNVRILSILTIPLLISGCSVFSWGERVKPIEIQTKAVERTRLNLPDPTPLKANPVEWIVVTPENVEEVWKRLREKNVDLVLFAITDDGYEQLSVSMAELRNFIAQQRQVIIKYKEYYEPKTPDSK